MDINIRFSVHIVHACLCAHRPINLVFSTLGSVMSCPCGLVNVTQVHFHGDNVCAMYTIRDDTSTKERSLGSKSPAKLSHILIYLVPYFSLGFNTYPYVKQGGDGDVFPPRK